MWSTMAVSSATRKMGVLVLEVEVPVSGSGLVGVGNLALHHHLRQFPFQQYPDVAREAAHRPDFFLRPFLARLVFVAVFPILFSRFRVGQVHLEWYIAHAVPSYQPGRVNASHAATNPGNPARGGRSLKAL